MDLEQVPSPASLGPDRPLWKFHGGCLMGVSSLSLFFLNFFLYTVFKVCIEFVAVLLCLVFRFFGPEACGVLASGVEPSLPGFGR